MILKTFILKETADWCKYVNQVISQIKLSRIESFT